MKKMMLSMVPDGILDGLCFDMELVSLSELEGDAASDTEREYGSGDGDR